MKIVLVHNLFTEAGATHVNGLVIQEGDLCGRSLQFVECRDEDRTKAVQSALREYWPVVTKRGKVPRNLRTSQITLLGNWSYGSSHAADF